MQTLVRGAKIVLSSPVFQGVFKVTLSGEAGSTVLDWSCFGLDANEKLADDRYMIFYNQKSSPEGAVKLVEEDSGKAGFEIKLSALPASIDRLVFTATIDGSQTMAAIKSGSAVLGGEFQYEFKGVDFAAEKALMVLAIYRKGSEWRLNSIGQGFNGGLSALLAHFGGQEIKEEAAPPPPSTMRLSLDKRMEKEAPHLLSLAKKATLSLAKRGLDNHRAKVALCLDISISMSNLYKSGKIQALADRVMALATRLDDDGELDIFLFGENGHKANPIQLSTSAAYIKNMRNTYQLEGGTRYHKAMMLIREHYCGSAAERKSPLKLSLPVYVMFLTDGGTSNQDSAIAQLRSASFEPIFWQFMAIRENPRTSFEFLEKLDDLADRFLDNADFFAVEDPAAMGDEELYEKMMGEYPGWLKKAQEKGIL